GCRWCRVARADGDSQLSVMGLPSGSPFGASAGVRTGSVHLVNMVLGWASTCSAATSTETGSRGGAGHALYRRFSCFVMVWNDRQGCVVAYYSLGKRIGLWSRAAPESGHKVMCQNGLRKYSWRNGNRQGFSHRAA